MNLKPLIPSSRSSHFLILAVLWTAMQIVLYWKLGVKIMIDSQRYIDNGLAIVNGESFGHYDAGYLSYILIVGTSLKLQLGTTAIVWLQLSVAAVALSCLYQTAAQMSRNSKVAFLTGLLYILWFRLSMWNFYILTESLFISCTIITFWSLISTNSLRRAIAYSPLWIFTVFLRPNGLALVAALTCFLYLTFKEKDKIIARGILVASISFLPIVLWIMNQKIDAYNFVKYYYISGEIISEYKGVLIDPPRTLTLPDVSSPPLLQWLQFILYNPIFFLKLCLAKLFFFFTHARPYYSLWNNAFILMTLIPCYIFAWIGLRSVGCERSIKAFVVSSIVFHAAIVMLYIEDWDGRFLLPILPLIFVFSGIGFFKLIGRFSN